MLITKEVEVKWTYQAKDWYVEKGYEFTRFKGKFMCKTEDLSLGSHEKVEYTCDYCGDLITATYQHYYKRHYNNVIQNDCCHKCKPIKTNECNTIKYGVPNVFQLEEVKDKIKNTCLEKYGVEYPLQCEEVIEKVKNTCLKKYGVDNASKADKAIEKIRETKIDRYGEDFGQVQYEKYKQTMNEKYGVDNYFMTEEFAVKSKVTCLEKYGVEHCQQNADIKNKTMNTLSQNNNVNTSRQQKYLHKILGGELNYCDSNTGSYSLDIAFPDKKIYIEYDGGFHNANIKLGLDSEKRFNKREMDRYFLLKRNGWKMVRITSPRDWLPKDDVILIEYEKALEWLRIDGTGHSHYNIDIGLYANDDKYGHLRKIKEKDLN